MDHLKLSALLLYAVVTLTTGDTVVNTGSGPVRGKTVASGKLEAYLGIPYAEPPVGHLRFAKPVPKTPWRDVYDATELPPPCIQLDYGEGSITPHLQNMTEDCLYLNVWVPTSNSDGEQLKAVMFFIHGGAFLTGSSDMKVYDGANLAEHGDVVVVTINYRVGALGFFGGLTEDSPGNQGLRDQVLALKWVKDNARHFRGDPDNIVIFGESAGSFSVSLLQISPLSRNLFKRAIQQSGSAVNPQYEVSNQKNSEISELYARELGCAGEDVNRDPEDIVNCLRNVTAKRFSEVDLALVYNGSFVLFPRFGDELFPDNAITMYQNGNFTESEVLMGVTRDEGSIFIAFIRTENLNYDIHEHIDFNRTTAFQAIKDRTLLKDLGPEVAEEVIEQYLDDVKEDTGYTYLLAVSDAIGDSLITCGNVFQAEYQSARGNPVYFYMFDHRTSASLFPEWLGVAHFEEIPYVFGNPLLQDFTEEEKELSRDVMDMWVSFARTGDPNIPGGPQWPRYTSAEPRHYVISRNDRVGIRPDNYRCDRWRNIFQV